MLAYRWWCSLAQPLPGMLPNFRRLHSRLGHYLRPTGPSSLSGFRSTTPARICLVFFYILVLATLLIDGSGLESRECDF